MIPYDAPARAAYPLRFRQAEARNRRLGIPLRLLARLDTPDPALLERIGERLLHRDEPAARLVAAMRIRDGSDPNRVTMTQFRQALEAGIETLPVVPEPLQEFFDLVDRVPEWVDFELLDEGAAVYRRFGANAADVLLQLALIGSYRFGGPTDLLVATGALTGGTTIRRLAETQEWAIAIARPNAMRRNGRGFQLTIHVRVMHALVNQRFETNGRWDTAMWGLPVNQSDQAATLGLFSGALLLGVRALGVRVTRGESRAVMHLWKYVGWLIGVDEDWLCDTESAQHRLNYHHLITQGDISAAGPLLANAVVDAQTELHYGTHPHLSGHFARERLLSMLGYFLRRQGMHELQLPYRPPWAAAATIAANIARYQTLSRSGLGRDQLERWGERSTRRLLRRYFSDDIPDVGQLRL
ncbi:oxygenase MpaB family protein [Nocardia sp. NPDC051570]|uniref:oxygenase MpaB family protein n=1 Tax=Nocardia sp. NPDC051570 TaxID=3364324 RepID=UPI0037ABC3BD